MKLIKLLLSLLVVSPLFTSAQYLPPSWQIGKAYHNGGTIEKAATDKDGNVYFILDGNVLTIAKYTNTKYKYYGSADILLVKMDKQGNVCWAKTGGGTGNDYVEDIAVDNQGDILLTGSFNSPQFTIDSIITVNKVNTINSNADVYLAKLDSSGTPKWIKNYGGTGGGRGDVVTADNSDNIYMAVSSAYSNTVLFDGLSIPKLLNDSIGLNGIVKLTPDGKVCWIKSLGSDYLYHKTKKLIVDNNFNIYVTGSYNKATVFVSNLQATAVKPAGQTESTYFVAKLDSSGKGLWIVNPGMRTTYSLGLNMVIDNNANLFLTVSNEINSDAEINLLKMDSSGKRLWIKDKIGGSMDDYCRGMAIDANSNIYLGDAFNSKDFTINKQLKLINADQTSPYFYNSFLIKYDSSGEVKWVKHIKSVNSINGANMADAVIATPTGQLFQFGSFNDTLHLDGITLKKTTNTVLTYYGIINQCNFPPLIITKTGVGNELIVPQSAAWYQWYYNDTAIAGANMNVYTPQKYGKYTVSNPESGGCTRLSEPYYFLNNTGINEVAIIGLVNIYPNPANKTFTVTIPETAKDIKIYSVTGQLVKSGPSLGETNISFEISEPGLYFVNVYCENGLITKKLVVY